MRPITYTLSDASGGAKSIVIPIDYMARPQVSLQVDVSGTVNWTIQQTVDNIYDTSITPLYMDHPDSDLVGQTVDRQGNYGYTPFAIKFILNSGSGSARISVIQAGTMGG